MQTLEKRYRYSLTAPALCERAPSSDDRGEPMGEGTILICDDEDRLRRSLVRLLGAQGFEVLEARSGEDALEVIGSGRSVSLLILDFVQSIVKTK
jgi:two-component system cell cycle sensor histidine kinase/response regulator CckA